jgi:hypothetical protein
MNHVTLVVSHRMWFATDLQPIPATMSELIEKKLQGRKLNGGTRNGLRNVKWKYPSSNAHSYFYGGHTGEPVK